MGDTSFSMGDNLKMCPPCGNIQKEFSGKKARVNPSEWIPRMDFCTKNYRFSVSILVNNLVFDLSMISPKYLCPPRVPHGNGSRSVRWRNISRFLKTADNADSASIRVFWNRASIREVMLVQTGKRNRAKSDQNAPI